MTQDRPDNPLALLDDYRLAHDWTWADFAAAMARVEIQMSPRTLHYLAKSAAASKPHDRTVHKIRLFFERAKSNRAAHSRDCKCRLTSRRKTVSAA
jgi:hypothetical protein